MLPSGRLINHMNKIILICDDDSDVRRLLACLLSPHYTVIEASDGREALRLIAEQRPDLVLLDLTMPGLGGLQTLKIYHATNPSLPTVVLTGHQELGIARRALTWGARSVFTKPFSTAPLLAEVRRAVEAEIDEIAAQEPRLPWRLKP